MEIVKELPIEAGVMLAPDRDAREHWIVVVKASFDFPESGGVPALSKEQTPLVYADEYRGVPGLSSIAAPYDFAPEKPFAEVILTGSAMAPDGHSVTELNVGLSVGRSISKTIRVIGDREWRQGVIGLVASDPIPFASMPLVYERAFGGMVEGQPKNGTHRENLVGSGVSSLGSRRAAAGTRLPNLEHPQRPMRDFGDVTRTACFGPVSPAWLPRASFAGTYDQRWLDDRFPLLPFDFDARFFQSAPTDQQLPELRGGEVVTILNMTHEGRLSFSLPDLEVPIVFLFADRADEWHKPRLDTVHIHTDVRRVDLTWRLNVRRIGKPYALRRILVGPMSERFWRRHHSPKRWYGSLSELIADNAER